MLLEISVALVTLIVCYLWQSQRRPKGFPPGPNGVPFLGYAPLLGESPHTKFFELSKQYGKIYSLFLGNMPMVVLNDINDIKAAFKTDVFSGRPKEKLLGMAVVPDGLVFNEGPSWVEQRRFSVKVLRDLGFGKKSMDVALQEDVSDLMDYFRTQTNKPINPRQTISISIINAIWRIVSSEKFTLDDPRAKRLLKLVHEGFIEPEQSGAVFFLPWFAKMFPHFTGFDKTQNAVTEMTKTLRKIIDEHKETMVDEYSRDYIDVILKKIKETKDPKSSFYGEEGIKHLNDTLITFFTAGSDTLTSSTCYVLLCLIHHPHILKKVQDELDRVVGSSRLPSLNDRQNLPYFEATLCETLRMSSIVCGAILHSATETTVFEGFTIPKRTIVMSNIYGTHHDENLWEKPNEFIPERFLTPEGAFKKNENLIPFGIGKRMCPADTVAMSEFFLYSASLIQNFNFQEDPNNPLPSIHDPKQGLVLSPKPFTIILKDRLVEIK